jgi:hypothetical protein
MSTGNYEIHLQEKKNVFEKVCKNCGDCCGANDDPCLNLKKGKEDTYFCKDYENRLGPQRTVSGKNFNCVLIREHIGKGTLRPNCSYRKI